MARVWNKFIKNEREKRRIFDKKNEKKWQVYELERIPVLSKVAANKEGICYSPRYREEWSKANWNGGTIPQQL